MRGKKTTQITLEAMVFAFLSGQPVTAKGAQSSLILEEHMFEYETLKALGADSGHSLDSVFNHDSPKKDEVIRFFEENGYVVNMGPDLNDNDKKEVIIGKIAHGWPKQLVYDNNGIEEPFREVAFYSMSEKESGLVRAAFWHNGTSYVNLTVLRESAQDLRRDGEFIKQDGAKTFFDKMKLTAHNQIMDKIKDGMTYEDAFIDYMVQDFRLHEPIHRHTQDEKPA